MGETGTAQAMFAMATMDAAVDGEGRKRKVYPLVLAEVRGQVARDAARLQRRERGARRKCESQRGHEPRAETSCFGTRKQKPARGTRVRGRHGAVQDGRGAREAKVLVRAGGTFFLRII